MSGEDKVIDRIINDPRLTNLMKHFSGLSPFFFITGDYVNFISKSKIFFLNKVSAKIVSIYYLWSFSVSFVFFITIFTFLYISVHELLSKENTRNFGSDFVLFSEICKKLLKKPYIYVILFTYYTITSSANNIINFLVRPYHFLLPALIPFVLNIAAKVMATLVFFIFFKFYPALESHSSTL